MAAGAALAAIVLAALLAQLFRDGYSPDEEYTVFAVRGIDAHGLPLLPSGLLYDRGIAYSYLTWLGSLTGVGELRAGRAVSLGSAILALVLIGRAVRDVAGPGVAWIAVLLVGASVPFWVAATSARFYAPFLAAYAATLGAMLRARPQAGARVPPSGVLALLCVLAAAARLTHELAFTLAAIPLAGAALEPRASWRRWAAVAGALVAGLAAAQAGLVLLHFLAPESGVTMIRRFFWWQVVNLLERPPAAPPAGLLLAAVFAVLLIRPRGGSPASWRRTAVRVVPPAAALLLWGGVTSFDRALDYPLDFFWHLAGRMPLLVACVLGLALARARGAGGDWPMPERAVHLLWFGWVLFFGIIDSGFTTHYLLLPVTSMLAAVAVDLSALARRAGDPSLARRAAPALLLAALVAAGWGPRPSATLAAARPTISAPETLPRLAADAPVVACTDELGCLFLAGRLDRWLALDPFLRERFVVSRRGREVGVYGGAPAVYRVGALFDANGGTPAPRVLVIDVFKDLPIGSSSLFLPRALAAEAVEGTTLLETGSLRVVELRRR